MNKLNVNRWFGVALVSCGCMFASVAGDDAVNDYVWTPPSGIGRGVVNIVTSPGEVFRDMSYYGNMAYADHPELGGVDGAIFGIIPGAVFTVARIVDGVVDCFTLGIWGNATHCDFFPTFFWQDLWAPDNPF